MGSTTGVDNLNAFRAICPNINKDNHVITSRAARAYNCVAWVLGDEKKWYEPTPSGQYTWPSNKNQDYSLKAYVQMFSEHGFQVCEEGISEHGRQRIALYAKDGEFTHAALQLPTGRWSSKLGTWEDIDHDTLEVLSGPFYGIPCLFMDRRQKDPPLL
jgi:hypothetical protein